MACLLEAGNSLSGFEQRTIGCRNLAKGLRFHWNFQNVVGNTIRCPGLDSAHKEEKMNGGRGSQHYQQRTTVWPGLQPGRLLTTAVRVLIVVHIVGYLVVVLPSDAGRVVVLLGLSSQGFIGSLRLWQVVTYPFLDGCAWGLISSLFVLLFFASGLEREWGAKRFLIFYLIMSVVTGLLRLIPELGTGSVLVGDLGVNCAILGAFAIVFRHRKVWLMFGGSVKAAHFVFALLFIMVLINIKSGWNLLWFLGTFLGIGYFKFMLRAENRSPQATKQEDARFSNLDI